MIALALSMAGLCRADLYSRPGDVNTINGRALCWPNPWHPSCNPLTGEQVEHCRRTPTRDGCNRLHAQSPSALEK